MLSFDRPDLRKVRTEGREYKVQVSCRLVNHDLMMVLEERMKVACLARMLSSAWAIMASRENWARCSRASAGREPANRNTTQSGVLS